MPNVQLDVYFFFTGNCKEAMEFYQSIFGGELSMQRYDEVPGEPMPNSEGKIMHSLLSGGDIRLMASDSTAHDSFPPSFISVSLSGSDEAKLQGFFDKLAEGGEVTMPLAKQFWGDIFGTLTDKYGVEWMVNINAEAPAETK